MVSNHNLELKKSGYTIIIFSGRSDPMSEFDDNVNVQVSLDNGDYYTATFFTLSNIQKLFSTNKKTGECAGGLYFYCSDMIIVERLTAEIIERAVADLITNNELSAAFDSQTPASSNNGWKRS
jgi:hypothetical protein